MRSGLPMGGLPRCREVGCPTDYDGYMLRYIWLLSKVEPFQYLWLLYFHDYFYDMMVTYIYAQLYVVKQFQVLRFLKMTSVKFLSMTFILLSFW